jgi:hypothetical protein
MRNLHRWTYAKPISPSDGCSRTLEDRQQVQLFVKIDRIQKRGSRKKAAAGLKVIARNESLSCRADIGVARLGLFALFKGGKTAVRAAKIRLQAVVAWRDLSDSRGSRQRQHGEKAR